MSLVALVSALRPAIKIRNVVDKAVIDDQIFRAHYRLTTCIFFASCLFVTATNLFGTPIDCICEEKSVPKNVMNTYCWIRYTFTLPPRKNQIHPGVGPLSGDAYDPNRTYHAYYQWVPFMLFFHGLCFQLPHWLWKYWEGGDLQMISDGIRGTAIEDNETRKKKRAQVVNYLQDTLRMHSKYAYAYFFSELLNFINVIVTMYLIDAFLNGTFMTYGIEVMKFAFDDQDQRNDTLVQIFPRVTKCTFRKYGPSGTIQNHDGLCVLALNNVNEKIYIFLWFWLILLGVLSFLALVYTASVLIMKPCRLFVITKRFKFDSKHNVNRLIRQSESGDFLLLHLLGQNLNTLTFRRLLEELNDKLYPNDRNKSNSLVNSHPNNQYPIYPEDINNSATMEIDRYRRPDPSIRDRKGSAKSDESV